MAQALQRQLIKAQAQPKAHNFFPRVVACKRRRQQLYDNNNTVYIYSIIVICFSVGSDEAPLLWCLGHILYLRLLP